MQNVIINAPSITIQDTLYFLKQYDWIASYCGAILTFATLIIARGARKAAREATKKIFYIDGVNTLSKVGTLLDQAQEHQRCNDLHVVPAIYSRIQSNLVSVRDSIFSEDAETTTTLSAICEQIRIAKTEVEKAISNESKLNYVYINKIITLEAEKVNEILTKLKRG